MSSDPVGRLTVVTETAEFESVMDQVMIFPEASVDTLLKVAVVALLWFRTLGPTLKLNDVGVIVARLKLGASGCASVNDPVMLQSGGQAAEPLKKAKGFPVMLYVVEATTGTSTPVPLSGTLCCEPVMLF